MKKHLSFYKMAMSEEFGRSYYKLPAMPASGLCPAALFGYIDGDTLDLFRPTDDDIIEMANKGLEWHYWGSGVKKNALCAKRAFTPLRQTIVLFMAAINEEL